MDELVTLYGLLSEHWTAIIGAVLLILAAIRTFLRGLVFGLRALDLALDGRYDWTWLGSASDYLDWLDGWLDRLPVKSIGTKSKAIGKL